MEEGERVAFLRCECSGHAIELTRYEDEEEVSVTVWHAGFRAADSFWDRVKLIWNVLRYGTSYVADVILSKEECAKLEFFLKEVQK